MPAPFAMPRRCGLRCLVCAICCVVVLPIVPCAVLGRGLDSPHLHNAVWLVFWAPEGPAA